MKRRYAFITAAAQGLGRAIARHLAAQQYTLLVHYYTSQPAAEALQAEVAAAGGQVMCLQADLASRADRERLVHQVAEITPELHVLVNNLGWYLMERLPNITIEQWERALTLNCTAAFHDWYRSITWRMRCTVRTSCERMTCVPPKSASTLKKGSAERRSSSKKISGACGKILKVG